MVPLYTLNTTDYGEQLIKYFKIIMSNILVTIINPLPSASQRPLQGLLATVRYLISAVLPTKYCPYGPEEYT